MAPVEPHKGPSTCEEKDVLLVQRFAQVFGIIYVLVGLAGLVPPFLAGNLPGVLGPLKGLLLGLFAGNLAAQPRPPRDRGRRPRRLQELLGLEGLRARARGRLRGALSASSPPPSEL